MSEWIHNTSNHVLLNACYMIGTTPGTLCAYIYLCAHTHTCVQSLILNTTMQGWSCYPNAIVEKTKG